MGHASDLGVPDVGPGTNPVVRFLRSAAAGGVVLAAATVIALIVANTSAHQAFLGFWKIEAGFVFGERRFEQSLLHWVDDALMALFFFVVGLEIKREFIVGELSTIRGAALPVVAALGGMLVPAALFLAFNLGGPDQRGWGVPMATDIAFALGVLALLGSRVPASLPVFLSALAIADDLGAIVVIAFFYTKTIDGAWLLFCVVPLIGLGVLNRRRVDEPLAYLAMGGVLWFGVLNSGIHATIAGVLAALAALAVPSVARLTPLQFTNMTRATIAEIDAIDVPGSHTLEDDRPNRLALVIGRTAELAAAPLQRIEFALLPFTTFAVLPLFALANAGVRMVGDVEIDIASPVVAGVVFGLVVGKPVGIILASWIAVRAGFASLPSGVGWRHIAGAGLLGGIGFTMSMFVANLAFGAGEHGDDVRVAILIASALAGLLGYSWLRLLPRVPAQPR